MVEVGQTALDFELPDQNGEPVRLSELRGQTVVVYFYPKADTPGCTTQACGIRDHTADYDAAGAVVLGISPDPVKNVKKFADKHDLRFHLLADEDHAVAEAWGPWRERTRRGKTFMGIVRSSFLIDEEGRVQRAWSPVTLEDTVPNAIDALKN